MTDLTSVSERPTIRIGEPGPAAKASPSTRPVTEPQAVEPQAIEPAVLALTDASVYYGDHAAVRGATMPIAQNQITAMIGPSGCGKSTVLRSLNRMNDEIPGARVTGRITYRGQDLYDPDVDPIQVRRHIGMVFQKPNPFPKSIYENVAYGLRINRIKGNLDDLVAEALIGAALWDEVKDKLKTSAMALSGGQQQRLCIARAIAVKPDVVLMDEPCSALDPIATNKIEDLMRELSDRYTIVIVTHNMQQAARVSHYTSFFTTEVDSTGSRHGRLVEFNHTSRLFTSPLDKRTEDYLAGRFG